MGTSTPETIDPPFIAFRFEVTLNLVNPPAGMTGPVCNAAFAECSGLEITMEPKEVREGGNNQENIHLMGATSYGQLTLKRGMTSNLDLWNWFAAAGQTGRRSVAQGQITLSNAAGQPALTFILTDCLPVKMRGPSLNAKDGQVAIEEMQLAYARLTVRLAGTSGAGTSLSTGSINGGLGLTGGTRSGASITAGLNIG